MDVEVDAVVPLSIEKYARSDVKDKVVAVGYLAETTQCAVYLSDIACC